MSAQAWWEFEDKRSQLKERARKLDRMHGKWRRGMWAWMVREVRCARKGE